MATPTPTTTPALTVKTYKHGDKGPDVWRLQRRLLDLGYTLPTYGPDGDLGPETLAAAHMFEDDRRRPESQPGEIRPETIAALALAQPYARGLDVSHHQPPADWAAVARAGYTFVIVKATQGRTYRDPAAKAHSEGARAAGLRVGFYHWWSPSRDPKEQADNLIGALAELGKTDLRPTIDVEEFNRLPDRNERLGTLIAEVTKATGRPPAIYTSQRVYDEQRLTVGGECPLWVACRRRGGPHLPPVWRDWALWQTGWRPGVPGIRGEVDRNLARPDALK